VETHNGPASNLMGTKNVPAVTHHVEIPNSVNRGMNEMR